MARAGTKRTAVRTRLRRPAWELTRFRARIAPHILATGLTATWLLAGAPVGYTVQGLGDLPGGRDFGEATGINDAGQFRVSNDERGYESWSRHPGDPATRSINVTGRELLMPDKMLCSYPRTCGHSGISTTLTDLTRRTHNMMRTRMRRPEMRTTVSLDDELLNRTSDLTGVRERGVLLCEALTALIERESARRLELATRALTEFDLETRFHTRAARGDRDEALRLLNRLDQKDSSNGSEAGGAQV